MAEVDKLMVKSLERLQAARQLHESNFFEDSISRSYYAMFFAARAILSLKGLSPRSHRGVIASVGDQFVKTGLMKYQIWKYLAVGESIREEADYSSDKTITEENSEATLNHAQEFIEVCKVLIRSDHNKGTLTQE